MDQALHDSNDEKLGVQSLCGALMTMGTSSGDDAAADAADDAADDGVMF